MPAETEGNHLNPVWRKWREHRRFCTQYWTMQCQNEELNTDFISSPSPYFHSMIWTFLRQINKYTYMWHNNLYVLLPYNNYSSWPSAQCDRQFQYTQNVQWVDFKNLKFKAKKLQQQKRDLNIPIYKQKMNFTFEQTSDWTVNGKVISAATHSKNVSANKWKV